MKIHRLGRLLIRRKPLHGAGDGRCEGGLRRSFGFFPLTMLGVGATVGTGIFFALSETVPKAGPATILSFLIAAMTAGLTALCYSELSFRIPAAGSSYSYAYATFGEFVAYLVAACLLLEYGLAAGATSIGWSAYLNNFLQNAFNWQIPENAAFEHDYFGSEWCPNSPRKDQPAADNSGCNVRCPVIARGQGFDHDKFRHGGDQTGDPGVFCSGCIHRL